MALNEKDLEKKAQKRRRHRHKAWGTQNYKIKQKIYSVKEIKKGQPGLDRKQIVLSQKSNETSFSKTCERLLQ